VKLRLKLAVAVLACGVVLPVHAAHTQARLVLAEDTARPGTTVQAGVHLHMDAGWHTYWRNSGQSGLPTTIEWQLPPGVSAGQIEWPLPRKAAEEELTTYVYEDDVVLLVPLKLAADLKPGPLTLKAKLDWLECETKCVKEGAEVEAALNLGAEAKPSKDAALLADWRKKLPFTAGVPAPKATWESAAAGDTRAFILEWSSKSEPPAADFFPDSNDNFEVQPATEKLPGGGDKVRLRVRVKKSAGDWPKQISGVVVQGAGNDRNGFEVKLALADSVASAPPAIGSGAGPIAPAQTPSLWKMLLYAFIGGLILNVMPCVLPVIALKILGFVSEASNQPGKVRKLGLIYAAGVLSSFLALALIVVGFQAAGHGAGWGFQFGNPYFLVAMTTLVTLIALNLFGVFEVTLSSGALSAASGLASKHGVAGAFFNGLLATVLATSCSAPFLGAAVGFAFALKNPAITIIVLLTVGIGMAAPYVVLSWHPAWLKFLPKPGRWMERFKVAMGFPMLAAAVWLCSLVAVHYGDRAWWMAVFLVVVGLAAWIFGEFVQRGSRNRVAATIVALLLLAGGYVVAIEQHLGWRMPIQESSATANAPTVAPKGVAWQKWSPEAVTEARAAGRPVVIDFTAKWCPTCNTIVKPAFENASVQSKLKEINAVALVADYTRFSNDITAELSRFSRAAVPLVVVYPRNSAEPPVAFDLVTSGSLLDALTQAAR
jgi:thiol:disulfide interchange protein DsbD